MDGVIPYSLVRPKYAWEVYWNPWSLWSCSCAATFFLSLHCQPNRIQYQVHSLSCGGFVSYDTVIIDIADHGQIQNTLSGMDIGNICDSLGVWSICLEIPVEQVLISVDLLSHLNPLFWSAYFGKQTIFSWLAVLFWGSGGPLDSPTISTSCDIRRFAGNIFADPG